MAAKSASSFNYSALALFLGLPDLPEDGKEKVRSTYWRLEDTIPGTGIVLVHYDTKALPLIASDPDFTPEQRKAFEALRGLIVDTAAPGGMRILCRSFGYTPTVTSDSIRPDGTMEFKDQMGSTVRFEAKTAVFQPCFEGTLLRRWKYTYPDPEDSGTPITRVFSSTHRRIDAVNSHWGESKNFPELYAEFNAPTDDVLFSSKLASNFCYIFLLSHPDLLMASKAQVGDGWCIFLRRLETNTPGTDADTEWTPHWTPTLLVPGLEDEDGADIVPIPPPSTAETLAEGTIYAPAQFGGKFDTKEGQGIRIVNRILSVGYSGLEPEELKAYDYRVWPGEAVIAIFDGGRRMLKIASRAYHWRMAVGGNTPNHLNRFYQLRDYSDVGPKAKKGGGEIFDGTVREYSYDEIFPYLGTPTEKEFEQLGDEIIKDGALWVPPTTYLSHPPTALDVAPSNRAYDPRDLRLRNIALCFAVAVPIHVEVDVTGHSGAPGYYARLIHRREDLITAMSKRFKELEALMISTVPGKRLVDDHNFGVGTKLNGAGQAVVRLLTNARSYAKVRKAKGDVKSATGKRFTDEFTIALDNLRNLLNKEHGTSLYALSKAFLEPRSFSPKSPPLAAPTASVAILPPLPLPA